MEHRPRMWPAARILLGMLPFAKYPYTGRSEACALCGSGDRVLVCRYDRRLKRLDTVVCARCGLIRTDPTPTADELERYYRWDYRLDYQFARRGPPARHLRRAAREAERRLDLLAPVVRRGTRVLDFGSGSGEFLDRAARAGCDAVGVEPGAVYATFARFRYGARVVSGPVDGLEFPAGQFDVITTHHVLEHLRNPVAALARLARWLRDDGVLYVSVPNMEPNDKPAFERFHFAHVHGFVPETLDLAAGRCGLEPDPRFARSGTTVVYRKAATGPTPQADPAVAARVVAAFPPRSVAARVAGCGWIAPMAKRLRRDVVDTAAQLAPWRSPRAAAAGTRPDGRDRRGPRLRGSFMSPRDIGFFLHSARSDAALRRLRSAHGGRRAAFDALYGADPDPWRSASGRYRYQRRKYDVLMSLLPEGRRFRQALDLGCGTGLLTERLAGLADEVVGVDISNVALDLARERCRALPNVGFVQGDALALDPSLDGRFDLVVIADTLYYLPPPLEDEALKALALRSAALLAPGGVCVLANHFFFAAYPDSRLSRRIHRAFRWSPALRVRWEHRRPFYLVSVLERAGAAVGLPT